MAWLRALWTGAEKIVKAQEPYQTDTEWRCEYCLARAVECQCRHGRRRFLTDLHPQGQIIH